MSLYQIQKLMYEVNRNPERRAEYRKDKAAFAARYDLTAEEKDAVTQLDIRGLYQLGVHPLLLRPFTMLQQISNEDYPKARAGIE
jgi:hypothetical protein